MFKTPLHCLMAVGNIIDHHDRDITAILHHLIRMFRLPCWLWWRHQMETFSALLTLCEVNHRSPVDSSHKGQWRSALIFFLIRAWTNGWANNRDASDLRHHPAHYDVTLMRHKITFLLWLQGLLLNCLKNIKHMLKHGTTTLGSIGGCVRWTYRRKHKCGTFI